MSTVIMEDSIEVPQKVKNTTAMTRCTFNGN
jgi:hypothetical protein